MESYMEMLARLAKEASRTAAKLRTDDKNRGLLAVADELAAQQEMILEENAKDVEAAQAKGTKQSLIDRLALSEKRIEDMAEGLRQIAALEDPIGEVLYMKTRPNGLRIGQKRVPLGVVGIIYESRPNVTADAFGLCFKTGNAAILRGGSDAIHSNQAIVRAIKAGLRKVKLSQDLVLLVEDTSRDVVNEMMKMHGMIDVLIPRGGAGLIANVVENSTVPVIETGTGNCHVYVDVSADIEMAANIVENAKTQRMGVCNACESLVVHSGIAQEALPRIVTKLKNHGVEIRYGKNMDGLTFSVNMSDVVTRIIPVAYNGRTMSGDAPWVDSENIDKYAKKYIREVTFEDVKLAEDASDGDEDNGIIVCEDQAALNAALTQKCEDMYESGADLPAVTGPEKRTERRTERSALPLPAGRFFTGDAHTVRRSSAAAVRK